MFTYDYPHPAVATDIAVFTLRDGKLCVLLILRGEAPFAASWALPGGFLLETEDLEACARRELREEAGIEADVIVHFANFSAPDRDPRQRVISVAYFALLASDRIVLQADTDAADAAWWSIDAMPTLAFDHAKILSLALETLKARLISSPILLALLPELFTLSALQSAFEAVWGEAVDKRNFRKRVLDEHWVEETELFERGAHRPARLFRRKH